MSFFCPKCEGNAFTYQKEDGTTDCKCSYCGHTWTEQAPG